MDLNERDSTPRVWQASMQESCRQLAASHMHTRLLPFIQKDKLVVENYDKKEDEEDETQMSLIKMEDEEEKEENGLVH